MTTGQHTNKPFKINNTLLNQKVLRALVATRAKQERSIQTCIEMVNVFMTLVERNGIAAVNVNTMSLEGRITRTNLYRYFSGHEDLVVFTAQVILLSHEDGVIPSVETSVVLMASAFRCRIGHISARALRALCPQVLEAIDPSVAGRL